MVHLTDSALTCKSLFQTWQCSQGTLNLHLKPNGRCKAEIRSGSSLEEIPLRWIEGLPPQELWIRPGALAIYFSETYVKLKRLEPDGHLHVYIMHRLPGGMFTSQAANKCFEVWESEAQARAREADSLIQRRFYRKEVFDPVPFIDRLHRRDNQFNVLSIDGGGIRGIIPLIVLRALEPYIGSICETFDLVGGASVGGLIAGALTTPHQMFPGRNDPYASANDVLDVFTHQSQRIFVKNSHTRAHKLVRSVLPSAFLHKAVSNRPIYSSSGIETVTSELLGKSLMKDTRTNVLIPVLDVSDYARPVTRHFTNITSAHAFHTIQDVALATAAPPMYFPQQKIGESDCIDGGIACNNPALMCYLHAVQNGVPSQSIRILSLGTGDSLVDGLGGDHHNPIYWATAIFPTVSTTASNDVDEAVRNTLGSDNYWRISPRLRQAISLDDASTTTIETLTQIGTDLVERNAEYLREIAEILRPDRF